MRRRRSAPVRPFWLTVAGAAVLLAGAAPFAGPALADALPPPPAAAPSVLPPVGGVARYRITREAQPPGGPTTLVSDITLRRKTPTTLTLEGVAGDPPSELTVLTIRADGSLQIPGNDTAATQDVALTGVVGGLNRSIALFGGETTISRDGWSATLPVSGARGSDASVIVPLSVAPDSGADIRFRGAGDLTLGPQGANNGSRRGGGRRGGFHGGGFPGGGFPGGGQSRGDGGGESGDYGDDGGGGGGGGPDGPPGGRAGLTVAVSVDGIVRRGTLAKLSIVETRSVTIDSLPYQNISGWTIEAAK